MSGAMTPTGMPPGAGGLPAPAPGGQPPAPGLPQGMSGPRPNVGATQPQANPGNIGAAMLDMRNGLELLQRALPNIPMGSPVWKDLHDVIGKLAKHASQEAPMSQLNQSALSMIRARSQNPMAGQMAKLMGSPPNAGPAMPQPEAAAA